MALLAVDADQLINGVASRLIFEGTICDTWPCWNEGTCHYLGDKNYTCSCSSRFTGRHCEQRIEDLCHQKRCREGDLCDLGSEVVRCPVNDFVTSCLSSPCLNGGSCMESMAGHRCSCEQPFHGPFCQYDSHYWSVSWTLPEVILFFAVIALVVCAFTLICCSYARNMGVYVSVPQVKTYTRYEEDEGSDEEEEDVIALGDLRKNRLRNSRTRETMLDIESQAGCSNPCLVEAVML